MEEERNGYLVGRGMFSTRHLISYSVAWEMLDSIQETLLYLSTENILSVKLKLVFYISYLIWGPFTPPELVKADTTVYWHKIQNIKRQYLPAWQWWLSVVLVQTCASAVLVVPLGSRCFKMNKKETFVQMYINLLFKILNQWDHCDYVHFQIRCDSFLCRVYVNW